VTSPGYRDDGEPTGPQIGKSDTLVNEVAPKLDEWVAMWRAAAPGFELDSLWVTGRRRWSVIHRTTTDHPRDELTFKVLGLPSPDGRHILVPDVYQEVVAVGDSLEGGGEPESAPSLVDLSKKEESVFEMCGTSCGTLWGTWLSPTRFALGGWKDARDLGQRTSAVLGIYSLVDSTVTSYVTRSIPSTDYEKYRAAWERWLLARYRSLERTHS
jgi:hypothetical protein